MIQEYFWKHGEQTFFDYGNYMPRKQRFPKEAIDLYMIDGVGRETQIKSFDVIRPNADADVSKDACLSLLEWANYLLEPHAGIDKNDDSKLDDDKDLKRPMMSYKITDDEINWKKETDNDTSVTNATASVTEEDKLWSNYDWSVEIKTGATLRHNIARALELSHSRYSKLKRLTNTQQDEKDTIELGMLSIMQMHYNETGTAVAKNWKDTFTDIYTIQNEEFMNTCKLIDSEMNEKEQETIDATGDISMDDDDEDSYYEDETVSHTRNVYSLFDDEKDSDDPEQNTLGKESGHEKIVGFDNQDVLASDNETTESGNAATKDVSEKSESDAAGNNKRPADDDGQVDKGKKAKKTLERDNDGVKYRIITRKRREIYS